MSETFNQYKENLKPFEYEDLNYKLSHIYYRKNQLITLNLTKELSQEEFNKLLNRINEIENVTLAPINNIAVYDDYILMTVTAYYKVGTSNKVHHRDIYNIQKFAKFGLNSITLKSKKSKLDSYYTLEFLYNIGEL